MNIIHIWGHEKEMQISDKEYKCDKCCKYRDEDIMKGMTIYLEAHGIGKKQINLMVERYNGYKERNKRGDILVESMTHFNIEEYIIGEAKKYARDCEFKLDNKNKIYDVIFRTYSIDTKEMMHNYIHIFGTISFMQQIEDTNRYIKKVYKLGNKYINQNNMFKLCEIMPFRIVDNSYLNVFEGDKNDKKRIEAGLKYEIDKGNRLYYIPENNIRYIMKKVLDIECESLDEYFYKKRIYIKNITPDMIYVYKRIGKNEDKIKGFINKLIKDRPLCIPKLIDKRLKDEQPNVVELIMSENLAILTGGPGTGKSRCIGAICDHLYKNDINFCVLAFTGTATEVIRNNLLNNASKGILYENPKDEFMGNKVMTIDLFICKNKVRMYKGLEVIIIDECSMVDVNKFAELLMVLSLYRIKKMIISGDKDQLPSIDTGNLLFTLTKMGIHEYQMTNNYKQLINTQKIIPIGTLITNHRSVGKCIPELAKLILEKKTDKVLKFKDKDYEYINDPNKCISKIDEFAGVQMNSKMDGKNIILIHTKKGQYGTKEMNNYLQKKYNIQDIIIGDIVRCTKEGNYGVTRFKAYKEQLYYVTEITKDEMNIEYITLVKFHGGIENIITRDVFNEVFENCTYYKGDRIICKKNGNYGDKETYIPNGQLCYVEEVIRDKYQKITKYKVANEIDDIMTINVDDIYNVFELGWVMTIHKSQGKGFNNVMIILPDGSDILLSNNLLYTAVTRCSERLCIVASNETITKCIERPIINIISYLEVSNEYFDTENTKIINRSDNTQIKTNLNNTVKLCEICGSEHKNRRVNRCNNCRDKNECKICHKWRKVKDDICSECKVVTCKCGNPKKPEYKTCYKCKFGESNKCKCGNPIKMGYKECYKCSKKNKIVVDKSNEFNEYAFNDTNDNEKDNKFDKNDPLNFGIKF